MGKEKALTIFYQAEVIQFGLIINLIDLEMIEDEKEEEESENILEADEKVLI